MSAGSSGDSRAAAPRRFLLALAAAGVALATAACDSGPADAGSTQAGPSGTVTSTAPAASSSPSPTTAALDGPLAPLTGLPAASVAATRRPVVAVDIAVDSGRGVPRGLDAADLVFQEAGSSSVTRLIALYQSKDATAVGPVGQTRPADGKLLGFFRPVLADIGGPKGFVAVLHTFPVTDATPDRASRAYRTSGRAVTVSTAELRRSAPSGATAPHGLLTYVGEDQDLATVGERAARTLTVSIGGHRVSSWTYSASRRLWTSTSGPRAAVANVVVERTRFKTVQTHHPVGTRLPSAIPYGRGSVVVASGPHAARGTYWTPGPNALTNYADSAGVPLRLQRGRTWVLLVPAAARIDVR